MVKSPMERKRLKAKIKPSVKASAKPNANTLSIVMSMTDFTVHTYTQLLNALIDQGYHFQTFHEYLTKPLSGSIVLRHDVDKRP